MADGDPQRVWYPEMVERLRAGWREGMPFEELVGLRDELDAMLQGIRAAQNIRQPVVRCPECGRRGEGAASHVSVRSMILYLNRAGIAEADLVYGLEKGWAAYRREVGLDVNGKPAGNQVGCGHAGEGR